METTALSDIWRDIETTEPSDRCKLAKELELPDLQARVLVQDRQLSQAIEGDDWLLIQLELPEVKRRDVALRNLTLLLGKSQIVTIHAGALDAEITQKIAQIPEGQRNLVTPHDAFNYFSHRYHVNVIAPQGVSTDSEVANADIEKTANYIVEHKVKAVFAESTTNPERMKKLQEVCRTKGFDVEIVGGEGNELFSDSLAPAGEKGDTYITMYRSNVDLIVSHLK